MILGCKGDPVISDRSNPVFSNDSIRNLDISSVLIINRTSVGDRRERMVQGFDTLLELSNELDSLKEFKALRQNEFPEKHNFGFYELFISRKDRKRESISVVYTMYHGVVIRIGHKRFKNDNLEGLVKALMMEPLE